MLDLAIGADGGSLAIGLDRIGLHHRDETPRELLAEIGRDAQDLGPQILDEASTAATTTKRTGRVAVFPPSMKVSSIKFEILRRP